MNRTGKRLLYALLCAGPLALAEMPVAAAHEIARTPYIAYRAHHTVRAYAEWPYWLQRDRDFQRWYVHSRYRYLRPFAWQRLYRLYRQDVAYHRHGRHYYPYRQWERSYSKHRRSWRGRHGD